jgi:hypothetical protein
MSWSRIKPSFLSPQEAEDFKKTATCHRMTDPHYGGVVVAWLRRDGHIFIESFTPSTDRMAR